MTGREVCNTIDSKERLLLIEIEKDQYGGYKQDLLENDLDEMRIGICVCSKCNGVMRNACLVNGPDQKLVCEVCKMGEDSIPMIRERKNISELRAKCPLLNRGCVWKGILGEIDAHLDGCTEFILNCSNKCGILLKRPELQNHCENECQLRIVKCEYCEATIQYKVVENHNRICKVKKMEITIQDQKDEINILTTKLLNIERYLESKNLKAPVITLTTHKSRDTEPKEPCGISLGACKVSITSRGVV